ncbi:hypothetical protein Cantr_08210 [Candida viswanathii]|uniref:DNA polymerase delta subunit 3 n=1 Tax=Candida viswanathii TaxID=5486 RepID=A0A367Y4G0_9ASCO|nr:hypothetical protein Cantr_08210 [Candida viswanathii]
MTMTASQNEVEYLASEIVTNLKPVTYHKFSRHLSIPVARAKESLLEYYEKNKDSLTASFIITGNCKSGKLVKLSKESDLESDLKNFDSVNCVHIYSVHQKLSEFTTTDIAREELKYPSSFDNVAEYEKNGMIKGPKIKVLVPGEASTSPVAAVVAPKKDKPKQTTEPKKEEPKKAAPTTSSLSSSYVSRKKAKNQPALPLKGLTLNYVSRKGEPSSLAKRSSTEPERPTYSYKSRKTEAKAPKERIIVSHDGGDHEEEEEEEDEPVKATSATHTSDLQRMFDNDDFTFSDDNEETPKAQTEELKSEIDVAEDDSIEEVTPPKESEPVEEPTEEPSLFIKDDNEEEEEEAAAPAPEEKEEGPQFIQEKDDNGYIVTRKAKPVTKPPKAKKPAPTLSSSKAPRPLTGSKKDGKKKQASLLDFFGKKK